MKPELLKHLVSKFESQYPEVLITRIEVPDSIFKIWIYSADAMYIVSDDEIKVYTD